MRKLLSVGKKRIRTARPQLPWKTFSTQMRRPHALGGPLADTGQQLWSGRDAGQLEEELLSASQDEGLRAGRVCGWGAGNSLDSRGDLWELRQTHERAQILGKSQLLPLFPEILRKIQQPSFQCGDLVSMCEVGREGGSWQATGGLVWV